MSSLSIHCGSQTRATKDILLCCLVGMHARSASLSAASKTYQPIAAKNPPPPHHTTLHRESEERKKVIFKSFVTTLKTAIEAVHQVPPSLSASLCPHRGTHYTLRARAQKRTHREPGHRTHTPTLGYTHQKIREKKPFFVNRKAPVPHPLVTADMSCCIIPSYSTAFW